MVSQTLLTLRWPSWLKHLTTWFHSFSQIHKPFTIAILIAGCRFHGFYPLESHGWYHCYFPSKQNGENLCTESQAEVSPHCRGESLALTQAVGSMDSGPALSWVCTAGVHDLQVQFPLYWGWKHSSLLKIKPTCFNLETRNRDWFISSSYVYVGVTDAQMLPRNKERSPPQPLKQGHGSEGHCVVH